MRIAIFGAGVVGVTTAWYLRQDGHEVQVFDRREGPGLETSFANGGQISADHASPWAKPGVPLQALKWMLHEDSPLLFRLRADPAQWRWGLSFLRNCTAERYKENAAQLRALGNYSREQLRALRKSTGLRYDEVARGILMLYTQEKEPATGWLKPEECAAIEPAVASIGDRLRGGEYLPNDESGDAYKFTAGLAKLCEEKGVKFRYSTPIEKLAVHDGKVVSPHAQADVFVMALGSYSPLFTKQVGITLPVYPLKGYSVTLPIKNKDAAWTVSLSDEAHKLVLSRLGDRLRIAGTAELNGYNTEINRVRCEAIVKRIQSLFPDAGDTSKATFWAGLRPATPSNVPIIGATRYPNLYLNTGHGTLGWTLACGSARLLTDVIAGRKPAL
jgi:D-amino-acid dehydrogenase